MIEREFVADRARLYGFRHLALSAFAVVLTAAAFAQNPPDIGRWSSNTAIAPTQGYGMGNPLTLTWSILRNGTVTGGTGGQGSTLVQRFDAAFGAGPGGNDLSQRPWFTHLASSFDRWAQVSGLSYVYENNDSGNMSQNNSGSLGVRGDVRIGGANIDGGGNVLAFNYFPNYGDMVLDMGDMGSYASASNNFRFLRNVVMHEHGHGIGCDHCEASGSNFLMEPFIDTSFDGPQYHDILLAQRGYGDKFEKTNAGAGNDTSALATSLGNLANGSNISIGNSARTKVVAGSATDFVSIDDQTDTDFYSFNLASSGLVSVSLEALGFTYNIGPQGGSQVSFNTLTRQNLRLALIGTDGSTILAQSDINSFGGNESVAFNVANAGTYFIRVQGTDNSDAVWDTQFYALSVNAVPEPATMAVLGLGALAVIRRRRNKK